MTAFADSLRPTTFDARNTILWTQDGHPEVLIRENRKTEDQTLDEQEALLRESEQHFAHMRDHYQIPVIAMRHTRALNKEGVATLFTIVDKIDGNNLAAIEHLPSEAAPALEQLYLSLAHYYHDAWKNNSIYWGDCRSDQFAYGHKHGETQDQFYLVDVDPEFYKEGDDAWHTIEAVVGSLCHDLIEHEGRFVPPVRFDLARAQLLEIISEILTMHPEAHMLEEAKGWLSQ